jgi:hypothetical protein
MNKIFKSQDYSKLSLADLITARDQFHLHLMQKANVVGTAVGLYLIRKTDPYPQKKRPLRTGERSDAGTAPKPARTLGNSEVRNYSWPAVLVFVSKWEHKTQFGGGRRYSPTDFVPEAIYLPDGRTVPICVVEAPLVTSLPTPFDPDNLDSGGEFLQPGDAIIAEVQGEQHVATIGCLLSDGHKTYALTNRHVAGACGEPLYAFRDGQKILVGTSSEKQIGRIPFQRIYENWAGKQVYLNVDVGLVELDNKTQWSPAVRRIGELGPLADIGPHNLSLNAIDCAVQACGSSGGVIEGRIAALFFRYKAVGGFEYIADYLIGSSSEKPLNIQPGNSGMVWSIKSNESDQRPMPLAVQWGGSVFDSDSQKLPFALASNLSTICRLLEVEVVRSWELAGFEYWGPVGHYTVGWLACNQITDPALRKLMLANQKYIGMYYGKNPPNLSVPSNFKQLADVPDTVWKSARGNNEKCTHYADLDYSKNGGPNLDQLTPNVASLKPQTWRDYYDSINWKTVNKRGLLPFRVWQFYKNLVAFVKAKKVDEFVTAAGILAHYVGDACQTLHSSYLTDGDPFRNPDGSPSNKELGLGKGYAGGLHTAYESDMILGKKADLWSGLTSILGNGPHGMTLITGGREAGFATVELMRRTQAMLSPKKMVEVYGDLGRNPPSSVATAALWKKFGAGTQTAIADGCRTLAMIWDSAWKEGGGANISSTKLVARDPNDMSGHYSKPDFLTSVPLDEIAQHL